MEAAAESAKKKDESPLPCSRLAAESLVQGSLATPLTFRRLREESRSDKLGESLELGDMCESASVSPHKQLWVSRRRVGFQEGLEEKPTIFRSK